MKKIVVEIDGVRHRLVKDRGIECNQCSLYAVCKEPICIPFKKSDKSFCHFEKEEEQV